MCICTITPQQLELDLAHTLKTPSAAAPSNDLFMPSEENFKAAVDVVLRESDWFEEFASEIIESQANDHIEQCVEEDVRSFFNHWDPTDYFDMDRMLERAVENYDFSDHINDAVDNYDLDDTVKDAVDSWMCDNFDPEEQVKDAIINDQDFINALAAAIVKHQQQNQLNTPLMQAAITQADAVASMFTPIQGDSND